jgi:hypothetical protein
MVREIVFFTLALLIPFSVAAYKQLILSQLRGKSKVYLRFQVYGEGDVDLTGDGDVGVDDLGEFVGKWLAGVE